MEACVAVTSNAVEDGAGYPSACAKAAVGGATVCVARAVGAAVGGSVPVSRGVCVSEGCGVEDGCGDSEACGVDEGCGVEVGGIVPVGIDVLVIVGCEVGICVLVGTDVSVGVGVDGIRVGPPEADTNTSPAETSDSSSTPSRFTNLV